MTFSFCIMKGRRYAAYLQLMRGNLFFTEKEWQSINDGIA